MLACERTLFVNDLAAAAYGILNNYNLQTRPLSQARTHTHTLARMRTHTRRLCLLMILMLQPVVYLITIINYLAHFF